VEYQDSTTFPDEKYPMLGSPLPFTIGLLFVTHSLSPTSARAVSRR
jgi:hypothetical protein